MKLLVETTGSFQLIHAEQREHVRPLGYTLIEKSQWANERISLGLLRTEATIGDEATDADWMDTLRESDGDLDLAVESFKAEFPADEESARRQEPSAAIPSATQPKAGEPKNGAKGFSPKPRPSK